MRATLIATLLGLFAAPPLTAQIDFTHFKNMTDVTAAMNNIATAMMVDPWGVSIELTEGLDKL